MGDSWREREISLLDNHLLRIHETTVMFWTYALQTLFQACVIEKLKSSLFELENPLTDIPCFLKVHVTATWLLQKTYIFC